MIAMMERVISDIDGKPSLRVVAEENENETRRQVKLEAGVPGAH